MHPNPITKGIGTLYISDGVTVKEIKPTEESTYIGADFADGKDETIATFSNGKTTLSAKLTHKEFYYKRKGKRYVRYSEVKDGISEKIWRKLIGE